MGPINLRRGRGPRGQNLGFSKFRALGGPLGAQEGQNHMFQELHFDLIPARIDFTFDFFARPLLFFPAQEILQFFLDRGLPKTC